MTKKAEKQVAYTLSTHAVENLKPSRDAVRLCRQMADGKLGADEAVAIMLRKHGVEKRAADG